ncbi:uncharacterized protein LOC119301626 isoform X2 [Triticum dicoccoides]|uniref:uncharacterized protein LOC119301626 isoform X2 n=1 Tax=Triticum dicoccoides TaxID=85692 RepID=UPI00188EB4F7|nr:uncharacterized protein LOC119301626 isoform X2 [Triticum dicoccoides]
MRPETLSPRHGDRAQYPSPSCTRLVLGPWRSSCSHRIWGRRTLTTTTLLNLTAMIMLPRPPYGGVLFHSDDSHWWPRFCFLPDIRRAKSIKFMYSITTVMS